MCGFLFVPDLLSGLSWGRSWCRRRKRTRAWRCNRRRHDFLVQKLALGTSAATLLVVEATLPAWHMSLGVLERTRHALHTTRALFLMSPAAAHLVSNAARRSAAEAQ